MNSLYRKIVRAATHPFFKLLTKKSWNILRYYPPVIPDQSLLARWQRSEWPAYQDWIDRNCSLTVETWLDHRKKAHQTQGKHKVTIVTPVYNTKEEILKECILSVRTQTSSFWEFILVDDGSQKVETHNVLTSNICKDPRIKVLFSSTAKSTGISSATNRGIDAASGDFVVFLDHDDRIAPEAIESVLNTLYTTPNLDIIYSDRDMISPGDKRFMHLMKPDWSPDNLYGGNYIFHLMCYRLSLVKKVGGLRSQYDGSQDYDLILRCMEHNLNVQHIPKVLYHWRQHETSVALDDDAKNYAFDAGMEALRSALKRKNISADVKENKSLWRGNYQLHFPPTPMDQIGRIEIPRGLPPENYTEHILSNPIIHDPPPFILIQSEACKTDHKNIGILASWLQLPHVGMVSGCISDTSDKLLFTGMTFNEAGVPFSPYAGYNMDEPGYMAITKTSRNISCPAPCSVIITRELWKQLGGLDSKFKSSYSLFDFSLSALQLNWRIMYIPLAEVKILEKEYMNYTIPEDHQSFTTKWKDWLEKGDPYYNINLKKNSPNYELA